MTDVGRAEGGWDFERLANQCRALKRLGYEARRDLNPTDGSLAARDMDEHPGWADDLASTITTSGQLLYVAEEHFTLAASAFDDASELASPVFTVNRTALETSSRAGWLLAPGGTAKVRAERMVTHRMASLLETAELLAGDETEALARRDRRTTIDREARRRGLMPMQKPPGPTRLCEEWIQDEVGDVGRLAYKLASAVDHGTLYALLLQLVPPADGESPDVAALPRSELRQVALSGTDVAWGVWPALVAYSKAAAALMDYVGRQRPTWIGLARRARQELATRASRWTPRPTS